MTADKIPIPIVDITNLSSSDLAVRTKVAREIGTACRETGFFFITGHGVNESCLSKIFDESARFFNMSTSDKEKNSIRNSPHNRGYVNLGVENLGVSGKDRKEAFNIGTDYNPESPEVLQKIPFCGVNEWPNLPGWKENMLDYHAKCTGIVKLLHKAFCIDLGIDESFFDDKISSPIATLRLLHYPAGDGNSDTRPDAGAGTHTDYGNVTLLTTNGVSGLQVQTRDMKWIDAPHIPGAFVCNIGDLLMRWTNNAYMSTPHRVRVPTKERYSIAFFFEPNSTTTVDARDLDKNVQPLYPPIKTYEYLNQRFSQTYNHISETTAT